MENKNIQINEIEPITISDRMNYRLSSFDYALRITSMKSTLPEVKEILETANKIFDFITK